MCFKRQLFALLLFIVGAVGANAFTIGSKVATESALSSSGYYVIYQPRNACYIQEPSSGTYANKFYCPDSNTPTDESFLFQFILNGDGTYKIKNVSTGNYMPTPTAAGIFSSTTESNAGSWNLQFDNTNGAIFPICNNYGWNRGSSQLYATTGVTTTYTSYTVGTKSTGIAVYEYIIYEVAVESITLTFDRTGTTKDDVAVNVLDADGSVIPGVSASLVTTSFSSLKTGSATALSRTTNSVLAPDSYANAQNSTIEYTFKLDGLAGYSSTSYNMADVDVYAMTGAGAAQSNSGNTQRTFTFNVSTGSTEAGVSTFAENTTGADICTVTNQDGGLYHSVQKMSASSDQHATNPLYIKVTLTKTATLGCYAGIGLVKLYKYTFTPTVSEVYIINNTKASNRGALVYDGSSTNVGAVASNNLESTNANHQWVIIPTGTEKQYYLYNVGAGKFAIPTAIAQSSSNAWVFSNNAVPVNLVVQNDGTYRIKMATAPVSGTNEAVIGVNRDKSIKVFNYNDGGSDFTITLVDGEDQSTAANAAVARLVKSQTALTSYPQESGWYTIQIKSKSGSASYAGRYLQNSTTLYNNLYPLTFTGGVDVQPAITDPTYLTYINCTVWWRPLT